MHNCMRLTDSQAQYAKEESRKKMDAIAKATERPAAYAPNRKDRRKQAAAAKHSAA